MRMRAAAPSAVGQGRTHLHHPIARSLACIALLVAAMPAPAQPKPEGFLCCNLRTDGSWISGINYAESGKRVIAVGAPAKVTGYGGYRVHIEIAGGKQSIGNDYSRDIELGKFAERYIVAQGPRPRLAGFPAGMREAIQAARVARA